MHRSTVILADDHSVVLQGLKRVLESEFDVVGCASDGAEAVAMAAAKQPDLVVADVSMPDMNGIEALQAIRAARPEARVVMLSMHVDETYAAAAIEAGALAYVPKHADADELIHALREALEGREYLPPSIADGARRILREKRAMPTKMTDRQREILDLITKGRSIKQIARDLGLSPKTVEYHKYRVMRLVGVRTSAELIRYAVEQEVGGVTPLAPRPKSE